MLQSKDTERLNGYKNKTRIYAAYRVLTSDLKTHRLKVRGWKKVFHANGNQKKARVAILISDKMELKIKTVTRDKEGHYMLIKGSIQRAGRVACLEGTEFPCPFPLVSCPRRLFHLAIPELYLLTEKRVHNSRAVSSVLLGAK